MSPGPLAAVERQRGWAVVRLLGDFTIHTAGAVYGQLRALARQRDLREVAIDFSAAGRVDSSGIAAVSLARRQLERRGVRCSLVALDPGQRALFDLLARAPVDAGGPPPPPGLLERVGGRLLDRAAEARALGGLIGETLRQTAAVATRRARLPAGALAGQLAAMGASGISIVALLAGLLGMTVAFQAVLQLERFGAGVFVADMIGVSMVRELGPLVTAVILTGRTGAAIAAELGTMQVRSEIDALSTMGISPVRFLVVPRLVAITFAGPALALLAMAVGIAGGALVALLVLDFPPSAFLARLAERVELADFVHGLAKSVVFSWIIGFAGAHLGLRAGGDASSVGNATTRTVVASIFFVILVDAIFATAVPYGGGS